MKPLILFLGLTLMAVCALFVRYFLGAYFEKQYGRALIFKGLASLCFVTLGGICCFTGNTSPTSLIIFIGLCLGIVGDEVIALCQLFPQHDSRAFIGGGSFFLVGHILYIIALVILGEVSWLLIFSAIAFISTLGGIYARKRKFLVGEMRLPLILYLGIVITVSAVAIGVLVKRGSVGAGLFVLGGLLFTVSDNILFAYKLGEKPRFLQNIALHVTYYLAQFAIAFSIALL